MEPDSRTKLEKFLGRNKVALLSLYFMSMFVCVTLLVLINNPGIAVGASAGSTSGSTNGDTGSINSVLWSLIAVGSFLLAVGVVYVISLKRRRAR